MKERKSYMYVEWKKNQPMIDMIPLEQYEELVMSYTSDLGMGIREELGKQYYYAFIMLFINGEKYCRYSLISKEEHDFGGREHEYCSDPDGITSLNFYNKYILNHEIIYEGIYNENILGHILCEIKQIHDANQTVTGRLDYENIYRVIAGKEFKNSKIMTLIVSVLFVIALLLKIFVPNPDDDKIWLNLIWMFALAAETAVIVAFIWMICQKKKFLSSSKIEEYAVEIRKHIVKSTPTEIVTKKYVFKRLSPSNPIDFSLVAWIYRKRSAGGGQSIDNIVFRMVNGKKREMNRRISFTESDVYHLVNEMNPSVMIGKTIDNYNRYKEIVKKRNNKSR